MKPIPWTNPKKFLKRQIAGTWVVVPLGPRVVEFNGIMTLRDSGAMLWRMLERGSDENEMVEAILAEYEVTEDVARKDVVKFLSCAASRNLFCR